MTEAVPLTFVASQSSGECSALLVRPPDAIALYVLAHGAGADMHHRFMVDVAGALARERIATLRYQFPYTQAGARRIDPKPILLATVRRAVALAREHAGDLPLVAGGKSMGGRMTSLAAAGAPLPGVRALVFLGFPLHPAKQPATERAIHLADVGVPMLFLSGTRDELATLELLRPVVATLGERATLHVVEHADHGFGVLKRSGRTNAEVLDELASATASFVCALRRNAAAAAKRPETGADRTRAQ
ncbi:MAG TPA: alpha/beta family hydrolase [Nannocystaceae bacterium]|nr:alpha/beta family hydrolase [Nannocystaceae bacterium]